MRGVSLNTLLDTFAQSDVQEGRCPRRLHPVLGRFATYPESCSGWMRDEEERKNEDDDDEGRDRHFNTHRRP